MKLRQYIAYSKATMMVPKSSTFAVNLLNKLSIDIFQYTVWSETIECLVNSTYFFSETLNFPNISNKASSKHLDQ